MNHIKPQKIFQFFWLFLSMLCAYGCDIKETDEVPEENKSKVIETQAPEPLKVRVVVPYAGNMPGFMNYRAPKGADQTEFQIRILRLLNQVNQSKDMIANKQFFLAGSDSTYIPSTFRELNQLIDGTNPIGEYPESLDVPKLFRDATDMKDFDKSVTVIVTDLVHNGSVKKDLSALRTLITNAFAKAAPNVAVSLFEETSKFNGAYFPAMRDRKEEHLIGSVPYYIIVIGPAKQVSKFNKAFLPDAPLSQVHFGLTTPINYSVLDKYNPKGTFWRSHNDPSGKSVEVDMADGPIEFEVGLDLSSLPSSFREPNVLAPIKVNAPNVSVRIIGGIKRIPDNGSTNLPDFTHTIRLKIDKLNAPSSVIKIILPPPSTPEWVSNLSLEDDNYPLKQKPGTYKLASIISGIQDAYNASYPTGLPPVFSLAIHIKKDE